MGLNYIIININIGILSHIMERRDRGEKNRGEVEKGLYSFCNKKEKQTFSFENCVIFEILFLFFFFLLPKTEAGPIWTNFGLLPLDQATSSFRKTRPTKQKTNENKPVSFGFFSHFPRLFHFSVFFFLFLLLLKRVLSTTTNNNNKKKCTQSKLLLLCCLLL